MSGGVISYERYAGMDARSWTGKPAFTVIESLEKTQCMLIL